MPRNQLSRAASAKRRAASGFSLLELVMVVAIMMILSAFAVPRIMDTMRTYQLTSAAAQVADAVKYARYEAVRKNIGVNSCTNASGGTWVVWTDRDCAAASTADRKFALTGNVTFLSSANVPTAGALTGAVQVGALTTLSASGSLQTIAFDPRGAVNFAASSGGAPTVYVFYVGTTTLPAQSYRAVVIMPSGATQVWTGSPGGAWIQIG
jgi:type IV fimbrial biogenesis protein FimT